MHLTYFLSLLFLPFLAIANPFTDIKAWKNPAQMEEICTILRTAPIKTIQPITAYWQEREQKAVPHSHNVLCATLSTETYGDVKAIIKTLAKDSVDIWADIVWAELGAFHVFSTHEGLPYVPPIVTRQWEGKEVLCEVFVESSYHTANAGVSQKALSETSAESVAQSQIASFVWGRMYADLDNSLFYASTEEGPLTLIPIDWEMGKLPLYARYEDKAPFYMNPYKQGGDDADTVRRKNPNISYGKDFPFDDVMTVQNPTDDSLKKVFGHLPIEERFYTVMSKKKEVNAVIYKDHVFLQRPIWDFNGFFSETASESTIEALQKITMPYLQKVFEEAPAECVFKKDCHLEKIVDRAQQVIRYFANKKAAIEEEEKKAE